MVRHRALPWFITRPLAEVWAWPTTLSLDAPAVALLWQALFARSFGVRLGLHHYLLLGASVWLVYAADRLLDGLKFDKRLPHTKRHRFYALHRRAVFAVWLAVLAGSLWGALALTRAELSWGFGVAGAALLYLMGVHLRARLDALTRGLAGFLRTPLHFFLCLPKETQVGGLFCVGAAVFLLPRVSLAALLLPVLAFGALCALNCSFIALWEAPCDRAQGQSSLALRFPGARLWLLPAALALAGAAFALSFAQTRALFCCVGVSSLALWGLYHLGHARFVRPAPLRVLADVALLTPLPFLLWPLLELLLWLR